VHVETAAGGVISVDMDSGDFTYDVPADASTGLKETFGYALVDADGDSAPSTLTIDVQAVDNPPIARDDRVVTNLPGGAAVVDIPTWALLYNDSDLNGDAVTVASILSASGGSAVLAAGSVAFTDPAPAGGSFVYEAAASGGTDKGTVTVIRQSASALDGLGLNDILIDGDGDGALNGNSGNDVLIGNGGNDVLIGSVGRDLMEGGAGADAFKYTFLTHSTASAFDTIRAFATGSDRIDLADLDANAGAAGDQAFTFVAAQSQAVIANSVTWYQQDGNTFVQADVNGDATADFVLRLLGNKALTAGDFTL
jgi:Ca2+-binding RTX toxin-like protein